MTRLLLTELRRNLSRRLPKVLGAIAILIIALAAVIAFFNTPSDAEASQLAQGPACVSNSSCRAALVPDPSSLQFSYTTMGATPRTLDFSDSALQIMLPMLTLAALILGASFIGAEWRAGTMSGFLVWEPRRVRVAAMKLLAAGLVSILFALFVYVVVALALLPVTMLRGHFSGMTATWLGDTILGLIRLCSIVGGAGVLGGAISLIGRNTTAALGVAFVYFAILESVLRLLFTAVWDVPGLNRWLLTQTIGDAFGNPDQWNVLGQVQFAGWGRLILYVLLVGGIAVYSFRKRDIASSS